MIEDILPYATVFFSTLVLTLVLTPLVRELHRRCGMVDKPDPRRINKVPIPRGGGVAVVIGVFVPYAIFHMATGRPCIQGLEDAAVYKLAAIAFFVSLVGFFDDKFSLRPRVKLSMQVLAAALVWAWAGLGFRTLWPELPAWIDCVITVLWVTGAINAFNLIDGLDGLAAGLALIAVIGIAGSLFFSANPQKTLFYFAMMGGLLGFLRYNFHPASVFLGDSGSMFLGFVIAVLPLASQTPNSFLVSVGVPLLAMGVPIFDTALAILRRTFRRLLGGSGTSGDVMSADTDHLHHRILRATGLNQRKAAWILYLLALGFVVAGLVGMTLRSQSAGFWLVALALAATVIFKDSSIELFDAGRLLNELAHPGTTVSRRRLSVLAAPFYVFCDVVVLIAVYFVCAWTLNRDIDLHVIRAELSIRVVSMFGCLVFFRAYRTVWSRALASNFTRLLAACAFGVVIGSAFVYYWPSLPNYRLRAMTLLYGTMSFVALATFRVCRGVVRDLFYAIDCSRLRNRPGVSRILVYGAGLRYRAFRRELVRKTTSNSRIIVGIIDDDICLRGHYIGGIRILGTINQAPEIIRRMNVDAVVIACEMSPAWFQVVRRILLPTGVKVTHFSFSETPVDDEACETGVETPKGKEETR